MAFRTLLLRLIVCAAFSISVFNIFSKTPSSFVSQQLPKVVAQKNQNVICPSSDLADDILVVLRTGATESREKVPVHFRTTLQCVPHFTIFSDFDEEIEGHPVRNVLSGVSDHLKESDDFKLYHHLQEHGREGLQSQSPITAMSGSSKGDYLQTDNPGWQLDKWKFLPMMYQALQERPEAKWFVFMEADTYLGWNNLLSYLSNFDDSKPYYIGKHLFINNVEFGYGGAGFILSNPAMRKFVTQRSSHLREYEEFTKSNWVGECGVGKLLADVGVPLHRSFPHFQGDSPATLDPMTNKLDRDLWCYPAITHHHLSSGEIEDLWQFEQEWYKRHDIMLRHSDIFHEYIRPKIAASIQGWDNILGDGKEYNGHDHSASADEFERNAWKSFNHCRALCDHQSDCLQFSFDTGSCALSTKFRLGYAKADDRMQSGWMLERVDDMFRGLEAKCGIRDWFAPEEDMRSELKMRRRRKI